MNTNSVSPRRVGRITIVVLCSFIAGLIGGVVLTLVLLNPSRGASIPFAWDRPHLKFQRRRPVDTSGFSTVVQNLKRWRHGASLEEISNSWRRVGHQGIDTIDQILRGKILPDEERIKALVIRSNLFHYEGDPLQSYKALEELRSWISGRDALNEGWLYTVIYLQGVAAMRLGENENCIECRGESSCILPIAAAAVHTKPRGSRLAIEHFTQYLDRFPDDLGVLWLLNLAHMTLGEHPEKVDPRYLISLDRFRDSEFDIGRFRDVGHLVGVNRMNQAGGAIMEDFDNDGLLDLAVTSFDPLQPMIYYQNAGDGSFEDRSQSAGVTDQLGGLFCDQTDYDNDGRMDIFIPRGAWLPMAIRPTLLRNVGDGTFADVTAESGLLDPVNSNSAAWADYDNDGWLDLFICCEQQANRLYHNRGDGTFEEVAEKAGLSRSSWSYCKGSTWIDFDNDGYPDLFVNNLNGPARLFHNNHDGSFADVTDAMGIDGPVAGFSCWAWDYDNDGWQDLFASCYDRSLEDVVSGLIGKPHGRNTNRLFHNRGGLEFEDRTKEAGLDMVIGSMGSNYGDFDNDGFLDMYLGSGEPNLATLIPNRMFKSVAGKRFADITGTSGTGNLQKGHAVACGDWDRDGDVDIFAQMGGAIPGDRYHNILFANPGQENHWLTVKLVGVKSNRAAIGARIKAVTAGDGPLTVYRHVSSGSSFGANPLEQTIGLARADRVASLEVHWPTSGTTQVFRDVPADRVIEITEFAEEYRTLATTPVVIPD